MTARMDKLEKSSTLIALCAPGVIPKPFDPITLAVQVRSRRHPSTSMMLPLDHSIGRLWAR